MEKSLENPLAPKKALSKKKLFLILGSVVLIIVIVLLTVFFLRRFQIINTVQTSLDNAASVMEKANGDNGYPQSLPSELKENKDVSITGGASFDGTSYCITGKSNSDKSVVYHKDSKDKQSQGGECPTVGNMAKPGQVTGLETTIISAGQLGLTWKSATGGVSYTLQCATDKDFTLNLVSTMKASQTRTCNNLKSGTSYFIRVRANNAAGAGSWSSVISATTNSLSTSPTNLTLKPISSTSIQYSWNPVGGAQNYVIEWATDINYEKDLKSVTLTDTSGIASELKPNTRYFFHVKAVTASFDAAHAAFSPQMYVSTPAS
jgi:hypothetical protein